MTSEPAVPECAPRAEVCPGRIHIGTYPHAYGQPPDDRCWWCGSPRPVPETAQGALREALQDLLDGWSDSAKTVLRRALTAESVIPTGAAK